MLLQAILRKNWHLAYYSKGMLFYEFLNIGFHVLMFLGISRFVFPGDPTRYAAFVLPALGALEIATQALMSSRYYVDTEFQSGTLELVATSTPSLLRIAFLESLWPMLRGCFDLVVYGTVVVILLSAGGAQPGLLPSWLSISRALLILAGILALAVQFWLLGLISAGIALINRRGNSINTILILAVALLSGVYFPSDRLPGGAQFLSRLSSVSALNDLLRASALSLPGLLGQWGVIAMVIAVQGYLCVRFFAFCLSKARREGTLIF